MSADDGRNVIPIRRRHRMATADIALPEEPTPPGSELPTIRIVNGLLDKIATQAEAALLRSSIPIYQRGRSLVRPIRSEVPASRGRTTIAAGLGDLATAAMVDRLCRCIRWEKFDGRAKEWRRVDPPEKVAGIILSRVGEWQFQPIAGVITTPTIRPDGSLLLSNGYDTATRLYHMHDTLLDISGFLPTYPTRDDAVRALADLQYLLKNFPVVTEVDNSVALSALITPVVRGAIGVAPMHAFRAPTAGSGKTFLVDVVSSIGAARPCPVATVAKSEEETEKRLAGLLLGAFPMISLDNVNGELGGDLLCQAIERPIVQIRPLGTSDIFEIESRATIFATGKVLRVRGDMTRRTLLCNLDAGVERPELRAFDFNPVETVLNDRARYVGAVLTIVLAHTQAGFPGIADIAPLASFQDWSRYVRGALIWLGCADPCKSMEQARDDDPELSDLREILDAWKNEFGVDLSLTSSEVVEMIGERFPDDVGTQGPHKFPRMREIVLRAATTRTGIDIRKLSNYIMGKEGRIVAGYRLRKAGNAMGGVVRWQVRAA